MTDEKYINCNNCQEPLFYEAVSYELDLPFCANKNCYRYLLFTMEPDSE